VRGDDWRVVERERAHSRLPVSARVGALRAREGQLVVIDECAGWEALGGEQDVAAPADPFTVFGFAG
jgi:hypothetical protein